MLFWERVGVRANRGLTCYFTARSNVELAFSFALICPAGIFSQGEKGCEPTPSPFVGVRANRELNLTLLPLNQGFDTRQATAYTKHREKLADFRPHAYQQ